MTAGTSEAIDNCSRNENIRSKSTKQKHSAEATAKCGAEKRSKNTL